MRTHSPVEAVIADLEKEMERIASMVMSGSCSDFVSYREMVANHKALTACVGIVQKVFSGDEDEGD